MSMIFRKQTKRRLLLALAWLELAKLVLGLLGLVACFALVYLVWLLVLLWFALLCFACLLSFACLLCFALPALLCFACLVCFALQWYAMLDLVGLTWPGLAWVHEAWFGLGCSLAGMLSILNKKTQEIYRKRHPPPQILKLSMIFWKPSYLWWFWNWFVNPPTWPDF